MFVTELRCVICGRSYNPVDVPYTCPTCGQVGTLDVIYDVNAIKNAVTKEDIARNPDPTLWRYRALMPLAADAAVPPLAVGGTPLYEAPRLAGDLGLKQVWVKDDGRNPTGSLKDRASAEYGTGDGRVSKSLPLPARVARRAWLDSAV
jgi:threonine synthase